MAETHRRGSKRAAIGSAGTGRGPQVLIAILGFTIATVMVAYLSAAPWPIARLNDFYREARVPYQELAQGHLRESILAAPPYLGSLVLRAPLALIAAALGGHWRAMYLATALPCIAAAALFCAWLSNQPRRRGGVGWASRLSPLLLLFFNPIVLAAWLDGHPEEILGAVLCAAGVVLATRGEEDWAALLIALAVINKAWALVAVPVVLVAMPGSRRLRASAIIVGVAGIVLIPLTVVRAHGLSVGSAGAQLGAPVGSTDFPIQLLWWFGGNSWIVAQSRKLIVLAAFVLAGLWWAARRNAAGSNGSMPAAATSDALLMLALVLLLRAALDPWNNLYYHVPFLLALLAYEVWSGRMPRLSVVCSILLFVVTAPLVLPHMGNDARAAAYAAIVIPMIGWMAACLLAAPGERPGSAAPMPLARSEVRRAGL
ncbi:MAG: hypothetical protein ACLP8S_25530 [Solirubrobacteraceae bacterium]